VQTLASTERELRTAVDGLQHDVQRVRELHLERLVQALIVALHTGSHWEKARWR